jgi:hypothetical protein
MRGPIARAKCAGQLLGGLGYIVTVFEVAPIPFWYCF